MGGIYQIRNLVNNKIYIGSAVSFYYRRKKHRRDLRKNVHRNSKLQRAWNKYGSENFIFEILEIIDDKKQLLVREQHFLDTIKPFKNKGYNILKVAGSWLGHTHSLSSKKKVGEKSKGRNIGEKSINAKLTWIQVNEIRKKWVSEKFSQVELALSFNVNRSCISSILRNKTWKNENYDNSQYSIISKKHQKKKRDASKAHLAKISWDSVFQMRTLFSKGQTYAKIAKQFYCSYLIVYRVINNQTWKEK